MRGKLLLLALLPTASCARCSRAEDDAGALAATTEVLTLPPALPAPTAWALTPVRVNIDIALPDHCSLRAPILRAPVSPSTLFFASRGILGELAVGDTAGAPARVTASGFVSLDPDRKSRPHLALPWTDFEHPPLLARLPDGSDLGAFTVPGREGLTRVGLLFGDRVESLGEGDAFRAKDLLCVGETCALLTNRMAQVAPRGAFVWTGPARGPASKWSAQQLLPEATESMGLPFAIASIDAAGGPPDAPPVIAVIADGTDLAFVRVQRGETARTLTRLPAPNGALAALGLPRALAMTYGTPHDEDGCPTEVTAAGTTSIRFEREGLPRVEVGTPAPPLYGWLRPLAKGAIAVWVAPLGCHQTRRVVYAAVVDANGAPGLPMAVGDAAEAAVTSSGNDVDLFLQSDEAVTWARLRCEAP